MASPLRKHGVLHYGSASDGILCENFQNVVQVGFQLLDKGLIRELRLWFALLESLARAFDGQPLVIEESLDLKDDLKILPLVSSLVCIRPERPDARKLALPVPENIGFNPDNPAHLPDPEISLVFGDLRSAFMLL